jgi:hypothetical protein
MNEFRIRATPEHVDYFNLIADEMIKLFSIPRTEAVGRINQFWGGLSFVTDFHADLIGHRTPEDWAQWIYYGGPWWQIDEASRRPAPYDPGKEHNRNRRDARP